MDVVFRQMETSNLALSVLSCHSRPSQNKTCRASALVGRYDIDQGQTSGKGFEDLGLDRNVLLTIETGSGQFELFDFPLKINLVVSMWLCVFIIRHLQMKTEVLLSGRSEMLCEDFENLWREDRPRYRKAETVESGKVYGDFAEKVVDSGKRVVGILKEQRCDLVWATRKINRLEVSPIIAHPCCGYVQRLQFW